MDVSCVYLSSPSTFFFARAPLKAPPLCYFPTHTFAQRNSFTYPPIAFFSTTNSSFPLFHCSSSLLLPVKSTQHDLITETTEALRAHLEKFRSTILEPSTNNEEKMAPSNDSESSSSTSSSSSSSESSESEEDESGHVLPPQRDSVLNHYDGESSMSYRHYTSAERIEVCTGGKCKQKGSVAVLGEFKKQLGGGSEVYVSASKCMGKCKHGPNVRVSCGEGEAIAPVLSGVHLEKVDAILGGFLERKKIGGTSTCVPPPAKEGNVHT